MRAGPHEYYYNSSHENTLPASQLPDVEETELKPRQSWEKMESVGEYHLVGLSDLSQLKLEIRICGDT